MRQILRYQVTCACMLCPIFSGILDSQKSIAPGDADSCCENIISRKFRCSGYSAASAENEDNRYALSCWIIQTLLGLFHFWHWGGLLPRVEEKFDARANIHCSTTNARPHGEQCHNYKINNVPSVLHYQLFTFIL